ncbi:MAG: hypothetical protein M3347_02570 [Armatimonadota bacterium]|nr:hypothetical protein [Armatimonadota bacterium]
MSVGCFSADLFDLADATRLALFFLLAFFLVFFGTVGGAAISSRTDFRDGACLVGVATLGSRFCPARLAVDATVGFWSLLRGRPFREAVAGITGAAAAAVRAEAER